MRRSPSVVPAAFAPSELPAWLLRGLAVLGLVASLLGRGVAPALPGTAAGIEGFIDLTRILADVSSVNLFFLAGMLTVWLAVASLAHSALPASYRLGILPAAATVVVLGIAALITPIEARWLLWMGVISGSVALVAVPGTLASPRSRAVGFVLLLVGLVVFLQVIARMLAVRASDEALAALFGYARVFSTLGFVIHVVVLAVLGLWLAARRWALLGAVGGSAVVFSLVVAAAASSGSQVGATSLQVLAARTFDELTRHPIPYAPVLLRHAVDVLTLVVVALVAGAWRRPGLLAAAASLALLGSGNADIPLCAVMLTLGALLGPLTAVIEVEQTAALPTAPPVAPEPAAAPEEPAAEQTAALPTAPPVAPEPAAAPEEPAAEPEPATMPEPSLRDEPHPQPEPPPNGPALEGADDSDGDMGSPTSGDEEGPSVQ